MFRERPTGADQMSAFSQFGGGPANLGAKHGILVVRQLSCGLAG